MAKYWIKRSIKMQLYILKVIFILDMKSDNKIYQFGIEQCSSYIIAAMPLLLKVNKKTDSKTAEWF